MTRLLLFSTTCYLLVLAAIGVAYNTSPFPKIVQNVIGMGLAMAEVVR